MRAANEAARIATWSLLSAAGQVLDDCRCLFN
jgi:hypothetical protein